MCVQLGNVVSANIYRADDAPLYQRGNSILIGINVASIVLFGLTKAYYMWKNKIRERKWQALTQEEREDYVSNTKDEGSKRLDWRFVH